FCNRFGLQVKVCHYPPGSSKWNPIEHRMFSFISRNWAAQPLRDYETVLKFIRTTKTSVGLKIRARLNTKRYKNGKKVSNEQMNQIALKNHTLRPSWNYSISPSKM
ncbi:MAG: ISAzo13 family transposase, partial [Desulfobacteraceae bacterium]|nr:ISAzo13 family transposase [Desulfobacteraceae bacterium]